MTALIFFSVALYLAIAFGSLKAARWILGRRRVVGTGFGIIALLLYGSFPIHANCSVAPVFVAPACDDCGDGKMIFACDSAGGAIAHATANIVHPVTAKLTAPLTYLVARKSQRSTTES
jgi:hypothetical protein